jgi:hypothetical protein
MSSWWAGLPAAQATVSCGGQEHRLRWQAGKLRALDHADADAERTLSALGGQRCGCVDMLDAWHRHVGDLRVLVLASRGLTDQLSPQPGPARPGGGFARLAGRPHPVRARRGWASHSVPAPSAAHLTAGRGPALPAPATADPEDELIELLQLGGSLPDRLAATVAAGWSQRLAQPDEATRRALPQLHAALYGRAAAALRGWLGNPALAVDLQMIDGRRRPGLSQREGGIRAELPFGWLVDVWAKGLAVTAGRFCLAATRSGGRWTLSTVGPDLLEPRPLTVELPADE